MGWATSSACEAYGFFAPLHDALRSRLDVRRVLTGDEVDAQLDELRAAAAKIEA